MTDIRGIEKIIVDGLKAYVSAPDKPCEVVRANQTGPVPPYPYIAYTITTPAQIPAGTFSVAPDGTHYITMMQTWSFTVQSADADECLQTALRAFDWMRVVGVVYLHDNGITVRNVGNINNRDNLITLEYEHRNGFDVTFRILHTVEMTEEQQGGFINAVKFE